jgi:hypothetical protein
MMVVMKHTTDRPAMNLVLCLLLPIAMPGATIQLAADRVDPNGLKVERSTHAGRPALKVSWTPDLKGEGRVAPVRDTQFKNGTIELEVAGTVGEGAGEGARGFIGVAFRLQTGRYEYFYLRPTNGRAEDQVRRNHSAQYASHPEFPWARLRKEFPEKYESYVDLEPGVWTKVKVWVEGTKARLFVHGNAQPTLVVNDLKAGDSNGAIGLWIGPGTVGYFSDLDVSAK